MTERRDAGESGFRPTPKMIGSAVLGVLLLVFVFSNTESTNVSLLVIDIEAPLWLVLAGVIVVSFGIGYVVGGRGQKRKG